MTSDAIRAAAFEKYPKDDAWMRMGFIAGAEWAQKNARVVPPHRPLVIRTSDKLKEWRQTYVADAEPGWTVSAGAMKLLLDILIAERTPDTPHKRET